MSQLGAFVPFLRRDREAARVAREPLELRGVVAQLGLVVPGRAKRVHVGRLGTVAVAVAAVAGAGRTATAL